MAVPAALVTSLAQALASQKAVDFATDAVTTVWSKIFRKDVPAVEADINRQLVELIGNIPTEEELTAAFAALEARLSATAAEQHNDLRRLIIRVGLGIVAVQFAALVILLALLF